MLSHRGLSADRAVRLSREIERGLRWRAVPRPVDTRRHRGPPSRPRRSLRGRQSCARSRSAPFGNSSRTPSALADAALARLPTVAPVPWGTTRLCFPGRSCMPREHPTRALDRFENRCVWLRSGQAWRKLRPGMTPRVATSGPGRLLHLLHVDLKRDRLTCRQRPVRAGLERAVQTVSWCDLAGECDRSVRRAGDGAGA